jgi:diketogulonate reductase-like aldo/keto reductase
MGSAACSAGSCRRSRTARGPAQVVLRWHLDEGRCAIPKSVNPSRIAENIDLFDFALAPAELAAIDALDTGVRGGPDPEAIDTRTYPAKIDNS